MYEIIGQALDSIGIENFYLSKGTYEGECAVYTYIEFPSYYADNSKQGTEYSILVNVYTVADNIESTKEKVISALNNAGIKGGRVKEPRKEKELYNI
ncbi:MAG: hypothetical protein Q4F66_12750, partial [Clostridium sp.]|nr:hypothetical protein [Clostridium sp.]